MIKFESEARLSGLDKKTREEIHSIDKIVLKILGQSSKIIDKRIDLKFDADSQWYSYVLSIKSTPEDTLSYNKQFIDYCIDNGLTELLRCNVLFRFETGEKNAVKYPESFRGC